LQHLKKLLQKRVCKILHLPDMQVQSAPLFGTGKAEGTLPVILLLFCPSNQ